MSLHWSVLLLLLLQQMFPFFKHHSEGMQAAMKWIQENEPQQDVKEVAQVRDAKHFSMNKVVKVFCRGWALLAH